jgi:hypothetical protein
MNFDTTLVIGFLAANAWPHIQKTLNFIFERIINLVFVKLSVEESSQFYYGLQEFILTERSDKIKNLHYQTFYDDWRIESDEMKKDRSPLFYNYGFQFIKYDGNLIFLSKNIGSITNTTNPFKNKTHDFSIYSLNRSTLEDFIKYVDSNYGKKYLKYYYSADSSPKLGGALMNKNFDNTFMEGDIVDTLKKDLDTFASSKSVYRDLGIRYKRTYLFYGPPGTGKSSLSTAIANYTKRNVFTITPSKDMTDSTLVSLIINRPIDSIVVFEDFDCLLSNISREKVEGDKKENTINISLSCILNILDGTYTPDNCIFIITTNDVEKIDPAIKRKGRTDVLLEIPQHSVSLLDRVRKKYNISDDIRVDSVQDIQNLVIKKSNK